MAAKEIIFNTNARNHIAHGLNALANAVKVTLGPRGRNVLMNEGDFGGLRELKDRLVAYPGEPFIVLNLVNNSNRRFDGEMMYRLDIMVGAKEVQRSFMEQSMGLGSAELDRMLEDPEENREPLGRMYVKMKSQWQGLLSGLGLDLKDGRYGLNPELAALEKYKPRKSRWFF